MYDIAFYSAVSLLCYIVGQAMLKWKRQYDHRDPWAYSDHEEARRLALLQASQELAVRCHAGRHLRPVPELRRQHLAGVVHISDARKVVR